MDPKYSVLLCNKQIDDYKKKIELWLYDGLKIIWFGNIESCEYLKQQYPEFTKEMLILVYEVKFSEEALIIDGVDKFDFVSVLEEKCPAFNAAQYRVEHCLESEHIIVQASAGTGKTKVMIDRIMFLMHTVPELEMSEIYMITFTNDATDQMNQKLQEALLTRFRLTGQMRYFRWVEQQSQMSINTIHSFAYAMLKEYGIGQSFTRNLAIHNFRFERKELIKDMMDQKIDDAFSVQSQAGLSLYKANGLVGKYWNGFESLGISHQDIKDMNWGNPVNDSAKAFQNLMKQAVIDLDEEYFDIKRGQDAISVNDIMRDLQEVLMSSSLPQPDLSMKYLFIDEFQDSDLAQIKVATLLVKLMGARLFVVGDVKQSIYRFRGATELSFDILAKDMKAIGATNVRNYILKNNYRTAANIMNRMNLYFEHWGRDGLLKYDGPVVPFNKTKGTMRMVPGNRNRNWENDIIADEAIDLLDKLIEKVESSEKVPTEKDRVVLLTRTNFELNNLAEIFMRRKVPAKIKKDGSFFTSETVRDFYTLISSYMFADEPKYIFHYLLTPYAGEIKPMDIHIMEQFSGNKDMLTDYLGHFLKQTNWEKYYKDFRLYPVMAVIKHIIDSEPIVDYYIMHSKRRKLDMGWDEKRINAATRSEAIQYQANLEKLLTILQSELGGDKVSLYDVYHYLQLQIATNRSVNEPDVDSGDDYKTILCMTVHKSKGLEFESVMIPFTGRKFPASLNTEILIDPLTKEVGWNYELDRFGVQMKNDLYEKMKWKDILKTRAEETRVLYVAMTRAINNLVCIVHPPRDENNWGYLLEELKGVDHE